MTILAKSAQQHQVIKMYRNFYLIFDMVSQQHQYKIGKTKISGKIHCVGKGLRGERFPCSDTDNPRSRSTGSGHSGRWSLRSAAYHDDFLSSLSFALPHPLLELGGGERSERFGSDSMPRSRSLSREGTSIILTYSSARSICDLWKIAITRVIALRRWQ